MLRPSLIWYQSCAAVLALCVGQVGASLAEQKKVQPVGVVIQRGDTSGALLQSPDKKLRVRINGRVAQLVSVATGEPVGGPLQHGFVVTCWAFSPDGKLVATGAGYKSGQPGKDHDSLGQVCVWEVATGRQVASAGGVSARTLGYVRRVAFSRDGTKVLVNAEIYDLDGW